MRDNENLNCDYFCRMRVGYSTRRCLSVMTARNWNTSGRSWDSPASARAVKLIALNRGGIGPRGRNIESGFRIPETRGFGSYGMCYSTPAMRGWASNSFERPNRKAALAYLRSFWCSWKRFAPIWRIAIHRRMLG